MNHAEITALAYIYGLEHGSMRRYYGCRYLISFAWKQFVCTLSKKTSASS